MSYVNLTHVNGLVRHDSLVAQWLEDPTGVQEGGRFESSVTQIFFFIPHTHTTWWTLHFSRFIIEINIYHLFLFTTIHVTLDIHIADPSCSVQESCMSHIYIYIYIYIYIWTSIWPCWPRVFPICTCSLVLRPSDHCVEVHRLIPGRDSDFNSFAPCLDTMNITNVYKKNVSYTLSLHAHWYSMLVKLM